MNNSHPLSTKLKHDIQQDIQQVVRIIENGGVVIMPADTVYGIYGNALNQDSLERAYAIKGRKRGKPFGIVATENTVSQWVVLNVMAETLIQQCWPAPISIIAEKNQQRIPEFFSGSEPGLLVVCAQNDFLSQVVEQCRVPIFSTTCNLAGDDEAREVEDLKPFRHLVDRVVENHFFEFSGTPSTIVHVMGENPIVLREGAYSIQQLQEQIPELLVNTKQLIQ